MAFSEMSSKERTIVAVLGVVILVSLIGIGILLAKVVTDRGQPESGIAVTEMPVQAAASAPTVTLVPAPSLEGQTQTTPVPSSGGAVVVVREEGVLPGAPVLIVAQPLHGGHRYRLEVTAADGSKTAIHGNWSQSSTSKSGKAVAPQIEFFEVMTPYRVDIPQLVSDPDLWGVSVSASLKDVLGPKPGLVITIWDVTEE